MGSRDLGVPVDTHRIVPAERHPLILKQCEPDPRRKMVGESKTQCRAETWAKNPLLTSKLLSGPGNNKRQLSNDNQDKNEKAATSLLGPPTFAKKRLSGLAGIGGKTMDFSSLTTNKLLSTQSCSISGKADMMSTNK